MTREWRAITSLQVEAVVYTLREQGIIENSA